MSYVSNSLLPGEQITHATRLHKAMFFWPAVGSLAALATLFVATTGGGVLVAVAALYGGSAWLRYRSSEFAVTNKRVIIKVGILHRRTVEMLLNKVEAISVDQGLGGRLLDYGTIVVVGSGGTREPFERIAGPLEFRRAVQAATL
ncbi:MAG: PH domain-containing protein [Pseudomonadota bacterium]